MKTPTIDEMKLAVARMLPDVLEEGAEPGRFYWRKQPDERVWREVLRTEWFHICWLAEGEIKKESADTYRAYCYALNDVVEPSKEYWRANVEQRIEALCRVKHPEMFTDTSPVSVP